MKQLLDAIEAELDHLEVDMTYLEETLRNLKRLLWMLEEDHGEERSSSEA